MGGLSGFFFASCGSAQHEGLAMEVARRKLQEALSSHEVAAALATAGLDVDIEIASSEEAERAILAKHGIKAWIAANSMQTGPIDTSKAKDVSLPTLLGRSAPVSLPVCKTMEKEGLTPNSVDL